MCTRFKVRILCFGKSWVRFNINQVRLSSSVALFAKKRIFSKIQYMYSLSFFSKNFHYFRCVHKWAPICFRLVFARFCSLFVCQFVWAILLYYIKQEFYPTQNNEAFLPQSKQFTDWNRLVLLSVYNLFSFHFIKAGVVGFSTSNPLLKIDCILFCKLSFSFHVFECVCVLHTKLIHLNSTMCIVIEICSPPYVRVKLHSWSSHGVRGRDWEIEREIERAKVQKWTNLTYSTRKREQIIEIGSKRRWFSYRYFFFLSNTHYYTLFSNPFSLLPFFSIIAFFHWIHSYAHLRSHTSHNFERV